MIEFLETDNWEDFYFCQHSKYPLFIKVKYEPKEYIDCTVTKLYKMQVVKEQTKSSKVYNKMSKEQIEQYVLDVIEIFLKK